MFSQPRRRFTRLFMIVVAATACGEDPTGTDHDEVEGSWTLAEVTFEGETGLPFTSGFGYGSITGTFEEGALRLRSDRTYLLEARGRQSGGPGPNEFSAVDEGSFTVSGTTITFESDRESGDLYQVRLFDAVLGGNEMIANGLIFGVDVAFVFATPAPPVYDLQLALRSMWVRSNCEDAVGNDGEWSWQVQVDLPGSPTERLAGSGGLSPNATESWADQTGYPVSGSLEIQGVSQASRENATITLRATEWDFHVDPPIPDPDMDARSQTDSLAETRGIEGDVVELGSGRCSIQLSYAANWTER